MKYGSVCSGIEAASVAWKPLGWSCAFVSEIEPFPCRVLAHHYPDVTNRGDMTRYMEWPDDAIDLLVGGTPCQSFSVAGLRAGMADPRGNLALVFLGLVGRARPRWVVWENVPGVLSSNGGRDFGAFLGGLGQLGYGWAYRVLDAQYFGVAQRRRRVFVVGCLGDWRGAAAVLFERACLRGDLAPSREAGACVAGTVEARTCRSVGAEEAANGHLTVYPIQEVGKRESKDQNGVGIGIADGRDPMFTLQAGAQHGVAVTGFHSRQDPISERGLSLPLEAKGGQAVLAPSLTATNDPFRSPQSAEVTAQVEAAHVAGAGVRRLTPRECERLQGFPDDYTAIPGAKDSPRYKALGNSMAVPVMRWIGGRIAAVDKIPVCTPAGVG